MSMNEDQSSSGDTAGDTGHPSHRVRRWIVSTDDILNGQRAEAAFAICEGTLDIHVCCFVHDNDIIISSDTHKLTVEE